MLAFTMITDAAFPTVPLDVCYLDGFFAVIQGGTNTFELSLFNQGLVWGPAQNTFTADDTIGNNWLIIGTSQISGAAGTQNFQTGVPFSLTTTGSLPSPLVSSTTYYAIFVDSTHIRVATSYANAIAGIAITLTTNGTPTNTIIGDGQLQQGQVTSHPGTLVACRTLHRRIFFFSQFFTEVWENAGIGTNLPFRRNNSVLMEFGTPAIGSIAVGEDRMFFLSQTRDGQGSVMMVAGTESIPVSNRALDFQLAQYAAAQQVADCRGFMVKENGLIFYRMNFTLANHTFVYDLTLSDPTREEGKLWHEEEVLNGNRHIAQTHSYINGINYVGHYALPILYILDSQTYSNDGQSIQRMRIGKPVCPPGYQRLRIDRWQIDLLQGNIADLGEPTEIELDLGTENNLLITTETGINIELEQQGFVRTGEIVPTIYFSISKDGGQTYGFQLVQAMGSIGHRTFRNVYRKLGTTVRGQAFVPKIQIYDQIPVVILGTAWGMAVLPQ